MREGRFCFLCPHCGEMLAYVNPRTNLAHCFACREDKAGTVLDEWEGEMEELSPVRANLEGKANAGRVVPVHLHSKVTEVGQLELWCLSRDGKQRWKLEYNVREER